LKDRSAGVDNIIYLSYGKGPHVDELAYAVHSTFDLIEPDENQYRVVVYTDNPEPLADLPVHIERLSEGVLKEWGGPFGHIHRRKILAVRDALTKFGGRLIYCDSDTFFVKHPKRVFARIGPGHSVLHIGEYYLSDACTRRLLEFVKANEVSDLAGRRWNITPTTVMFNAGVVGIHESDISLLDEILHLSDQIYPPEGATVEDPRRHADQFAFSVCFQYRTKLHQSYDALHHYWPIERRARFREELNRLLHDVSIESHAERMRQLSLVRPSRLIRDRPFKGPAPRGFRARVHAALWRTASRTGVLVPLKRVAARTGLYRSTPSA
jgi:hypothetical protein